MLKSLTAAVAKVHAGTGSSRNNSGGGGSSSGSTETLPKPKRAGSINEEARVAWRESESGGNSGHVTRIEIADYYQAVGHMTFSLGDGRTETIQTACPDFLERHNREYKHLNENHASEQYVVLKLNEYWVGLKGHLDEQDGEQVLMLEELLLLKYKSDGTSAIRSMSPCRYTGYPTGKAVRVEWQLPQGYAVRSLRGMRDSRGGLLINGLVWKQIDGQTPSRADRVRLRLAKLFNMHQSLLDTPKMWFIDVLGLTFVGFYFDVALDLYNASKYLKSSKSWQYGAIMLGIVGFSSLVCSITSIHTWLSKDEDERLILFGKFFDAARMGRLVCPALVAVHACQLHMMLFVSRSLWMGCKSPMLLLSKEVEALLEAPLTSLVQCYSLLNDDIPHKTTVYLSMLSAFVSLGMAVGAYDSSDAGLEDLPGRVGLSKKYAVLVLLRAFECALRITSVAMFFKLFRVACILICVGDVTVIAALLFWLGRLKFGISTFVRTIFISTLCWRNPLLETSNAASIPCEVYYALRLVEMLLMLVLALVKANGPSGIYQHLKDDWFVMITCFLSALSFYSLLPYVRLKWTSFYFRNQVSLTNGFLIVNLKPPNFEAVPPAEAEAESRYSESSSNSKMARNSDNSNNSKKTRDSKSSKKSDETLNDDEERQNKKKNAGGLVVGAATAGALIGYLKDFRRRDPESPMRTLKIKGGTADGPCLLPALLDFAPNLEDVDLSKCGLSAEGASALFQKLQNSQRKLKHLRLDSNPDFGNGGAQAAAKFLQGNMSLETLNLDWTGMTDAGVVPLFAALQDNSTLKKLSLRWCEGLTDAVGHALITTLEQNKTLQEVSFFSGGMSQKMQENLDFKPRVRCRCADHLRH